MNSHLAGALNTSSLDSVVSSLEEQTREEEAPLQHQTLFSWVLCIKVDRFREMTAPMVNLLDGTHCRSVLKTPGV